MEAIKLISQDLFDKIRSRFSNLEMGDDSGGVTIDPADAYYFDFDFVIEGTNLGRVSISLGDLGSLKVYYSQGITENQDDPIKKQWFAFLKEMRFFAMRRKLRFDTRDITKNNLNKTDFQHLATTQGPKEEDPMNTMNESRWSEKSSRKTSRAVQGKTEVIVRHGHAVDEEYAGSRSQKKNIKAIFIQNSEGERFKYPFIHPAGAFAMAQHVDHGGTPHDPAGKAIINMSEQIAQLGEFQRKIQRTNLNAESHGITERAIARLGELKGRVAALSKRHHYENWMAEFSGAPVQDDDMVLDDVTMEEYKSKFTQSTFQEELSAFFPLIHRIMSEENTVDLEDYVSETDKEESEETEDVKEDAFNVFEEWADTTERGEITDDEVNALADAVSKLPQGKTGPVLQLGDGGSEAIMFFNDYGLSDMDLQNKLKDAASSDAAANPFQVLKSWAEDEHNYPGLMQRIGLSAPAQPAPEAPAAPAPVAEGDDAETEAEPSEEAPLGSMFEEIAKLVSGRFNKDNMSVGAFNGKENIALEVKKDISEKFGEASGDMAEQLALEFMEKLSQDRDAPVEDDGLSRIRELMGHIGSKIADEGWKGAGVGGMAGGTAGEIAGGALGTMVGGPIGGAIGAVAGDVAGTALGAKVGDELGGKDKDTDESMARLRELMGHVKSKVEGIGGTKTTDEGILSKAKEFGKKVLDKVAPGDDELLKRLEKDTGGKRPNMYNKPAQQEGQVNELSKGALKSYSKAAGHDIHADQRDAGGARDQAAHSKKHGDTKQAAEWDDEASWLDKRAEKRAGGVAKATTKIAQKQAESTFEAILRLAKYKK